MKTVLLLIFTILSFVGVILTSTKESIDKIKDLIPPPPLLEHYSIGMKPQLADLLWIRALQDFDYCEKQISRNTCRGNSWLFHMIDTIVNLDPDYEVAYSLGGLALTIIISDYEGASKIFDKGVARFPENWPLLYKAAYHALYEERNFPKASDLYKRAGKYGAPEWTIQLADRLNTREGQIEVGERMLADLIRRKEDEKFVKHMREKIEEAKNRAE